MKSAILMFEGFIDIYCLGAVCPTSFTPDLLVWWTAIPFHQAVVTINISSVYLWVEPAINISSVYLWVEPAINISSVYLWVEPALAGSAISPLQFWENSAKMPPGGITSVARCSTELSCEITGGSW